LDALAEVSLRKSTSSSTLWEIHSISTSPPETSTTLPKRRGSSRQRDRSRRRKIDLHVYKERHLVENFFCRLKHYRRAATRFDKTAANFLGFVLLAAIRIWLA